MTVLLALLLGPLLLGLPFARGHRRRSLALLALLVAGFGLGAATVQLTGRPHALNLAVLALLVTLFRLAGAFEARGGKPASAPEGDD